VFVHGLCGSHSSPYLVRLAKRLAPLGCRIVRFNMRGCGSGKGLAKQIYHSGRSDDVFAAIQAVKKEYPSSPITLVGFSLGGNIVLKLAGELGAIGSSILSQVIAVSPPVDLFSSVQLLGDPSNRVYEKYFYRILRAEVYYRQKLFKDLPQFDLPRNLKLYEFDQIYTAPCCGFTSADDYYAKCSAFPLVPDIGVPCRILLSEDDPIIRHSALDDTPLPSHIELFKTKQGGHMGYLGHPTNPRGVYWLDSLLEEWILGRK
jgi:predicted alpha/beta-fold hydrolase